MSHPLITEFERLIRRDPARRGLIGGDSPAEPLGLGELEKAAQDLAVRGARVAIVTGFFVPTADPPAAETDGPPGATLLAEALRVAGIDVSVVTDPCCEPVLSAALEALDLPHEMLLICDSGQTGWIDRFFVEGPGRSLTHLVAIERVGPSHTLESIATQRRTGPAPAEAFDSLVTREHRDRCHNMRGEIIDDWTAPLHRLFEELTARRPEARSIGIGDGGNEIGMGRFAWEAVANRLGASSLLPPAAQVPLPAGVSPAFVAQTAAPCIPCRVATDCTIVAGTSNWGAYALAASTLLLTRRADALREWDADRELQVLHRIVDQGPAVDGITRRRDATVDGLPFLTYIQPWIGIRRCLGWES